MISENIDSNPLLDRLPSHLKQFIKPQNYQEYTAINQAVWRFVMRKNVSYLNQVAHHSYLKGLNQTGISIEQIPSMYGMNRILKEIGWAAVAVDGFIPPNAFMEFQAYNVLVIASDIRQLENMEYTPAPDIIHEAAGHAPIISNPDYAEYLRRFGQIGSKAISSNKDYEMYEAVRLLSILKESPDTPKSKVEAAEKSVEELQNKPGDPSEMSMIRNLHWWTVEYGLIGTVDTPKIYGAGLLSSIGESAWCMTDKVKKIPYSIEAAYQNFDITQPQPQLFVTPDFAYLCQVLEEFANTMALRTGSHKGLAKLIESKKLGTIELSTGLQISGVFTRMIKNEDNDVIFFQTTGPTALAYREKEIVGHGTEAHFSGFGSAIGKLKGINLAIEDMGPRDLKAYNFYDGERIQFEFESGITLEGLNVTGMRNPHGKLIMIRFTDCTVKYKSETLFKPEWGNYDLAIGKQIASAYSGPADYNSFDLVNHISETKTLKTKKNHLSLELESLYENVREMRLSEAYNEVAIIQIFNALVSNHPNDWLLSIELVEILNTEKNDALKEKIISHLEKIKAIRPKVNHLINSGLELINT